MWIAAAIHRERLSLHKIAQRACQVEHTVGDVLVGQETLVSKDVPVGVQHLFSESCGKMRPAEILDS